MDLASLVRSRRTVHSYRAEKISDQVVEEALNLALWAPNHKLSFPYVFVAVGPMAREKLAALAVELKQAKDPEPISAVKAEAIARNVMAPSHLIALGIRRSEDAHRQHEDYAALACAVQIAALALWDKGVVSKWSTGGYSVNSKTYKILGLDSQKIQLEGCLMIGQPETTPPPPERPSLDNFYSRVP